MSLRVGSVVFATNQGLGILAKSFYDAGILTDVVVIEHSSRDNHPEWYPNSPLISPRELWGDVGRSLVERVDTMLFFETAFEHRLIAHARAKRVKTVMMPMYECMPRDVSYQPDLYLCPSRLDLEYYPNGVFLPIPVNVSWKKRETAKLFVHNAGHGGLMGRNGTEELLQAIYLVKSPAQFLVRAQKWPYKTPPRLGRVEVVKESVPYSELYDKGDIFIFPEKFNGLSLPLQEAYASGMGVMCTNRYPMTTWLPTALMIPESGVKKSQIAPRLNWFDESVVSPKDIAATIDEWYGKDISIYSEKGRLWAEDNSWEALKPKYIEALS